VEHVGFSNGDPKAAEAARGGTSRDLITPKRPGPRGPLPPREAAAIRHNLEFFSLEMAGDPPRSGWVTREADDRRHQLRGGEPAGRDSKAQSPLLVQTAALAPFFLPLVTRGPSGMVDPFERRPRRHRRPVGVVTIAPALGARAAARCSSNTIRDVRPHDKTS